MNEYVIRTKLFVHVTAYYNKEFYLNTYINMHISKLSCNYITFQELYIFVERKEK
jgi:hypothetical protein